MLGLDLNEAQRFLSILKLDNVNWRFFTDDDNADDVFGYKAFGTLDQTKNVIQQYQSQGCGVYLNINEMDGKGNKTENIVAYNWCVADLDGTELPQDLPLTPAVITYRDSTHTHIYWPIKNVVTVQEYNYIQKRIAFYLDSDQRVVDPTRVLRLPGSLHLKDPNNPKQYKILHDYNLDKAYTSDEFNEAFKLSAEKEAELNQWINNRKAYDEGTGFNDEQIYIDQFTKFASKIGTPAGASSLNRGDQAIQVALYGYDRGVRLQTVLDIMWEHYNPRCLPPWTDRRKLDSHITHGFKYAGNAPGCKTNSQQFLEHAGVVAEPTGGWEKNKEKAPEYEPPFELPTIPDSGIIREDMVAEIQINSKTKPALLAKFFIGMCYPEGNIMTHNENVFVYDGKSWRLIKDDLLEKQIDHMYDSQHYDAQKVSGIAKTVKLKSQRLVMRDYKRGVWINPKEGQYFNCKNGILKMTTTGELELLPHDRDFFDKGLLSFDYNPKAKCTKFFEFLDSVFPNDEQMKKQMQHLFGACLMENSMLEVIPLLIGKSRSGKGVTEKLIRCMLGGNVASPPLDKVDDDTHIELMAETNLVIISEANDVNHNIKSRVQNALKRFSGGDSVTINRKFKSALTIEKLPMIMMVANEMPGFSDSSGAFANRLWPFHFTNSFYGREDTTLLKKLTTPNSMSGIFNWALQGASEIISNDNKLYVAPNAKLMIEELRDDTDPLAGFINTCCWVGEHLNDDIDVLFKHYSKYCYLHGVKLVPSQVRFTKMLAASYLPVHKKRRSAGKGRQYYFSGIAVRDEVKQEFAPVIKDTPT